MEVAGRKQSRSKSFLTRKATKKQQEDLHAKQNGSFAARSTSLDMQEKEQDVVPPLFNPFALSIIPDPLNELPTWYHREVESATVSTAQFRVKYPLHNPTGPRWYRNHHLLRPSHDGRPPSVFSPFFPPMASAPERGQDPSGMAGPSRTPSGSPLPTPSSSQIRIQEPSKPRSRKVSQNTQDNVDMSDGTDTGSPNGISQLSYDQPVSPISPSPTSPNHFSNRPRRASVTHGTRHRTVAPSPLSQSTSAVHLHVIDPAQIQLPRKLSKRRKPFTGLFGGNDENVHTQTLRRQSTMAPSMTSLPSLQPSMQKPKRGSVLGRLVKRFSVMRKTDKSATQNGYGTDWRHVASPEPSPVYTPTTPTSSQSPEPRQRTSSRLSRSTEPVKRVPPPSIDTMERTSAADDRRSSESLSVHEMPTSGRLMVANPDDPSSSGDTTPVGASASLPSPYIPGATDPSPSSKEDLSLPEVPRTPSLLPINPRYSVQLSDPPVIAPLPPSSPPLPELPPPTPAPGLQTLFEVSEIGSPAPSTIKPPSSPAPVPPLEVSPHLATSPASTPTPLPVPEDPALARASMFVNPPTPYNAPAVLSISPVMAESQLGSKRADRSPTKSKDRDGASRSKSIRQTETFKLVRSPSGTMKQAEVIMGMGEQWAIVGAPAESPKKSKSTKEKEREREKEKAKSPDRDQVMQREESRRRREHSSSTEEGDSRHRRHPSSAGPEKPPLLASIRSTQTPVVSRRSVKKSSDAAEGSRSSKAASAHIPLAAAPSVHGRERHLSTAATMRPNSEIHSAADLSSVRAKDAWEMERLWKARSMAYGPDGMPVASTPATIGSDSRPSTFISTELQRVSSIPSVTAVAEVQKASSLPPSHGSSHTYVVVQTPYQQSQPAYSPFASPPPQNPAIFPAQQFYRHASYTSPDPPSHNPLPSPPRLSRYESSPLPMSVTNPLPDPPRLSTYQPAPLPASLASPDGSPASWTRNTH